jgi:hypothetical protein
MVTNYLAIWLALAQSTRRLQGMGSANPRPPPKHDRGESHVDSPLSSGASPQVSLPDES